MTGQARRAFTLIEVLVATVITSIVALAVIGMVEAFRSAVSLQDHRSEAIVRGAGIQSHLGLLALKSRMALALSEQRVLLWLPSESLEESGAGSESEFDRINFADDELHWLEFVEESDASWTLVEWTIDPAAIAAEETATYFTADPQFWDDLFVTMRDAGQLDRAPRAEGLQPPVVGGAALSAPHFVWQTSNTCENRSIGAEFSFVAEDESGELRSDLRIESALAFFDRHPVCTEGQQ